MFLCTSTTAASPVNPGNGEIKGIHNLIDVTNLFLRYLFNMLPPLKNTASKDYNSVKKTKQKNK